MAVPGVTRGAAESREPAGRRQGGVTLCPDGALGSARSVKGTPGLPPVSEEAFRQTLREHSPPAPRCVPTDGPIKPPRSVRREQAPCTDGQRESEQRRLGPRSYATQATGGAPAPQVSCCPGGRAGPGTGKLPATHMLTLGLVPAWPPVLGLRGSYRRRKTPADTRVHEAGSGDGVRAAPVGPAVGSHPSPRDRIRGRARRRAPSSCSEIWLLPGEDGCFPSPW